MLVKRLLKESEMIAHTVELSIRRRLLATPDRVCRHKGLCLSRDGCEDAFLREALAVGAASVFRLIKARAANLATRQYVLECDARVNAKVYLRCDAMRACRTLYHSRITR